MHLSFCYFLGHPVLKGRAGHTTTLVGNKLFILGGRNGNLFFDDLWVFDMDLEQWNQLQQKVPFAPRAYHTATLIDDQDLWVIGGSDQSTMFDDVHVLNTTTLQVKLSYICVFTRPLGKNAGNVLYFLSESTFYI
jgi:N-acetylneuraminic acid mutarotase